MLWVKSISGCPTCGIGQDIGVEASPDSSVQGQASSCRLDLFNDGVTLVATLFLRLFLLALPLRSCIRLCVTTRALYTGDIDPILGPLQGCAIGVVFVVVQDVTFLSDWVLLISGSRTIPPPDEISPSIRALDLLICRIFSGSLVSGPRPDVDLLHERPQNCQMRSPSVGAPGSGADL